MGLAVDVVREVAVECVFIEQKSGVTVRSERHAGGADVVARTGSWTGVVTVVPAGAVELAIRDQGQVMM